MMVKFTGWQSSGYSNPNLLINWDFRCPVNQRGKSSYTGGGYTIDMVKSVGGDCLPVVTINNGYVTFENTGSTSRGYVNIMLEDSQAKLDGIAHIISVAEPTGNILIAPMDTEGNALIEPYGGVLIYRNRDEMGGINIALDPGKKIDISAVKLEAGIVSTLALDLMQPSDYAAELRKCQRYFYRIGGEDKNYSLGTGYVRNTTGIWLPVPLPVAMRARPLISANGEITVNSGGNELTYSHLESGTEGDGMIPVATLHLHGSGYTPGDALEAFIAPGVTVDFSAEL